MCNYNCCCIGIGGGTAKALVENVAKVIGVYNEQRIEEKMENLNHYQIDLQDTNEMKLEDLWRFSLTNFKCELDILINCAGINLREWFENYTLADWNRGIEINWKATFTLCRFFAHKHINAKSS